MIHTKGTRECSTDHGEQKEVLNAAGESRDFRIKNSFCCARHCKTNEKAVTNELTGLAEISEQVLKGYREGCCIRVLGLSISIWRRNKEVLGVPTDFRHICLEEYAQDKQKE
jgi:hypothetical protein